VPRDKEAERSIAAPTDIVLVSERLAVRLALRALPEPRREL